MDSLEEEKLIQMVIDYIEFEPNRPISNPPTLHQKSSSLALQDVLGMISDAEIEILEKILPYSEGTKKTDGNKLNIKNRILWGLKMDGFEVSLCRTSWFATFGRPSGNYEYIDVMMKKKKREDEPTRIIVDLDFRSQFEIVRPTQTYSELLNSLPCIFVGTEDKIMKVISLICLAAKLSLKERGLHIPPWRKASYMQSKWLSKNCTKVSYSQLELPLE